MTKGGKNLALLGIFSILIAVITTSVSLAVYHNSGDIYLDRSRPGFLPDEQEIEEENEHVEEYNFDKTGKLDIKIIEEYLEHLQTEVRAIDAYEKPFSAGPLSDQNLGITK